MARKPRIHFPGAFYHVMIRGNDSENIFFSDNDRYFLFSLLNDGVKRFNYIIHAYCLMNNHAHFLIQVSDIQLSKIIHNLSFRYTQYINYKRNRMGHLFQGRYRAILIDADNYLLELVRYIHLNPVRAGMVKNVHKYKWSGHKNYIGKKKDPWLTVDYVLSLFSKNKGYAMRNYKEFIMDGIGEGYRKEFDSGNVEGRILGEESFAEKVLLRETQSIGKKYQMDEIINVVCERYSVETELIRSKSRNRRLAGIRKLIGYLVVEYGEVTLSEYSKWVERDITTMSREINGIRESIKGDKRLRRKINRILTEVDDSKKG